MEVPGRRDSSRDEITSMEPESRDILCDPCLEDGHSVQTEGYCVDCEHYLCTVCFQTHLKPKPVRHHKLLNKHQMPLKKTQRVYNDECTDKCATHKDKLVEYWCENHDVLGCSVCMTIKHRACDVGYIPALSEHLFESAEYLQFKTAVENLLNRTETTYVIATCNLADIKQHADAAVAKVREFRQRVNDFFDKLENKILDKIKNTQLEDQRKLEALSKRCETIETEMQKIEKDINDNASKSKKNRMFVDMKLFWKTIKIHQLDVDEMERDNKVRQTLFLPSQYISDLIRDSTHPFGSLSSFHKAIPVHTDTDTNDTCDIPGMAVLSNGRIALADRSNKCVKIVDTTQGPAMSRKMSRSTRAITTISDNEIAVIQDGNIGIYSIGDQIELKKTIKNTGLGWALVYTHNTFIGCTLSDPQRVRMVNMDGKVVKTYPTEFRGEQLFDSPWYIAVHPAHTAIYVADITTHTLTSLSIEGEVKALSRYENDWCPRGVTVSRDGLVYVNDDRKNVIHVLTANLKKVSLIDGTLYGITKPVGLAYCPTEQRLYVGMFNSREIVVLNV